MLDYAPPGREVSDLGPVPLWLRAIRWLLLAVMGLMVLFVWWLCLGAPGLG